MSSIYRKGRDGYYYYQTYVRDPNTGKKNKRIFHSLNTKDEEKAREKQKKLDKTYEQKAIKNKYFFHGKVKKYINIITLMIITSLFTMFIANKLNPSKEIKETKWVDGQSKLKTKIPEILNNPDKNNYFINNKEKNVEKNIPFIKQQKDIINKTIVKEPLMPIYEIERTEVISNNFSQIKIFLTVSKNKNEKSLKKLCQKIKSENPEYSNVMICIYSSNIYGKNLAKGYDKRVSNEQKIKAWLGMYTYNPVEGGYLDINPGKYLGIY